MVHCHHLIHTHKHTQNRIKALWHWKCAAIRTACALRNREQGCVCVCVCVCASVHVLLTGLCCAIWHTEGLVNTDSQQWGIHIFLSYVWGLASLWVLSFTTNWVFLVKLAAFKVQNDAHQHFESSPITISTRQKRTDTHLHLAFVINVSGYKCHSLLLQMIVQSQVLISFDKPALIGRDENTTPLYTC